MKSIFTVLNLAVFIMFSLLPAGKFSARSAGSNPPKAGNYVSDEIVDAQYIPPLGDNPPSLKFIQSFGEFQVPYYDEPSHLNFPGGVAADGDRVWIAEYVGKRALLYNSDGSFVKKINRSMMYLEFVLAEISTLCDVAVLSDHNVWLSFRGTVVKVNPDGGFIAYATGEPVSSYECHALAVDSSDRLYVSDVNTHLINVYDSSGAYQQTIGTLGSGELQFNRPMNIAVKDGILYVAEHYNNRIQIIDVHDLGNISFVAFIDNYQVNGFSESLLNPAGVAVDNTRIIVADTGNQRVEVFDRTTRQHVTTLGAGGQGSGNDQWNEPFDIAVDANGLIYISDMNNHRVKQYDTSLVLQRIFGETGVAYRTDEKHFNFPNNIQADHAGNIYVSETSTHRVVKLTPQGTPLFGLGTIGEPGDDPAHFNNPNGLAVDSSDRLYVADELNHRIVVFDGSGTYLTAFGSYGTGNHQFRHPIGVAIDPTNDDIYVADLFNGRIQIFDETWVYKNTIHGVDSPMDVAVGSDGNIYISDGTNSRLIQCRWAISAYACVDLVGEFQVKGEPFFHFQNIRGLAVDSNNLVYMVDHGLGVVYIYDSAGKFYGALGGLLPLDVTIDTDGNVYVTNSMNQQIDQYSPVDVDWKRVNIQNFGDNHLFDTPKMVSFGDFLYAGYSHWDGAQVWRTNAAGTWQMVGSAATFGANNRKISAGVVFQNNLYLGTENIMDASNQPTGGEIFRYDGSNWSQVAAGGLGTPSNVSFQSMVVFNNQIYTATSRVDYTVSPEVYLGAQIFRSPSGNASSWEKVLDYSILNPTSTQFVVRDLEVYNNILYAGVWNMQSGAEIWRSSDGTQWELVSAGAFTGYRILNALASKDGYMYLGMGVPSRGAQIWRCDECDSALDFELVLNGGFDQEDQNLDGFIDNFEISDFQEFHGYLYAWTRNHAGGSQTWRSRNGVNWERFNPYGFGTYADGIVDAVLYNDTIYAGSSSTHVWQIEPRVEVVKAGSGSGQVTSFPAGIDCGASCSHEFAQTSSVQLTASAAPGSVFTGWSGEGCSGIGICTVTAGPWRSVTANFEKQVNTNTLTVESSGDGMGFITTSPAGILCGQECRHTFPTGTLVQLFPQAQLGSFAGWTGACQGMGSCIVDLSADQTVTALFWIQPPVVEPFTKNGVEDNDLYFTPADFGIHFSDADNDSLMRIRITGLPQHGTLKLVEKEVILNQEIAYTSLAKLYYQPAATYTGQDQFTWKGSDGVWFSNASGEVNVSIMPDADGDGQGDALEANVAPLLAGGLVGDGNGDGFVDTAQSNVASLTYVNSSASQIQIPFDLASKALPDSSRRYLTLELPEQFAFVDVQPVPYPSGNPAVPQGAAAFPLGFIEIYIKGITPGAAVDIVAYVDEGELPDLYLAYGAQTGDVKFHWYDFTDNGQTGAVVERFANRKMKYTLHYVDGLKGDNDLTENGFIRAVFGVATYWRQVYLPVTRQ